MENQRGRPPEVIRMAEKYRSKKDKNKVIDIRAHPVAREAKPPRQPTKAEVRANNKAAFETGMCLFDLSWIEGFDEELAEMNRGKVGAPFRYTDSMIFWISLIMSYLDLDFRKAVESLILYRRHLAEELGDSEPGLILVTQDGYLAMRDSIDPRSRHTLERYRKRDINGKVMFYDSVRELGSRQFVKFAKRHLNPKFTVS